MRPADTVCYSLFAKGLAPCPIRDASQASRLEFFSKCEPDKPGSSTFAMFGRMTDFRKPVFQVRGLIKPIVFNTSRNDRVKRLRLCFVHGLPVLVKIDVMRECSRRASPIGRARAPYVQAVTRTFAFPQHSKLHRSHARWSAVPSSADETLGAYHQTLVLFLSRQSKDNTRSFFRVLNSVVPDFEIKLILHPTCYSATDSLGVSIKNTCSDPSLTRYFRRNARPCTA